MIRYPSSRLDSYAATVVNAFCGVVAVIFPVVIAGNACVSRETPWAITKRASWSVCMY